MAESGNPEIFHQFVGREDFLKDLQAQWPKYRIFGVFGFKSVGKTRTVEEFLSRLGSRHPTPDVINVKSVDLQAVKTEKSLLFKIQIAFGLIRNGVDEDISTLMKDIPVLPEMSEASSVIMYVDNAEDVIESPAKDLFVTICETLIEHTTCVRIVFTSTVVVDFPGQKNYYTTELPLLSHSDGVALLCSVTPNVKYTRTFHKLEDLCLGLPLAILMTGCELEMDNCYVSPEEMVVNLTKDGLEACNGDRRPVPTWLEVWGRECSYAEQEQLGPVYRNFIKRLSVRLRKRLAVLGYIPGSFTKGQAQQLLGDASDQSTTQETLVPLSDRHMVTFDDHRRRYNIHGILKDCLEFYFRIEHLPYVKKRYCQTFCKVVQTLSSMISATDFCDAIANLNHEYPNVKKLLVLVTDSCEDTFPFYIQMVKSSAEFIQEYFSGDSVKFYVKLLDLCEEYDNPRADAIVSRAYGTVLTNVKGDLLTGEEMYRRALHSWETDSKSVDIAAFIFQSLGWNLNLQGRMREAYECLRKAHAYQTQLGMNSDRVALSTLTSIGLVLVAMGRLEEGKKYQMESIKKRIQKHGKNHPHIGSMYNNLGELYDQRGDHENASYYTRRGLEIKRENNACPLAMITSLNSVASLEIEHKNFPAAKENLEEAWLLLHRQKDMMYSLLKDETLWTYGKLYLAEGKYKDAIITLGTVTENKKDNCCGGIGHVECLLYFGRALRRGGNPNKALLVFNEALSHKEELAKEIPQNTLILECLEEKADILTKESHFAKGDNSQELLQLVSDGEKELLRIISHYWQT